MWRPLYQTDGTVVLKCFQFRPSHVAVCFVGLFTGRSVGYNNVADRVVYSCDSILLFEEPHLGKRRQTSRCEFRQAKGCRGKLSTLESLIRLSFEKYLIYYKPQFSIFSQLYKNSLMIRRLKWRIYLLLPQ